MAVIDKLDAIGNAIREKTGDTEKYTLDEMPQKIEGIAEGPTDSELVFSNDLRYWNYFGQWNTIIEKYHSKMVLYPKNMTSMFENDLSTFDISDMKIIIPSFYSNGISLVSMFETTRKTKFPKIVGENNRLINNVNIGNMFRGNTSMKGLPDDYFNFIASIGPYDCQQVFSECFSLRKLPTSFCDLVETYSNSSSYHVYNKMIYQCFCLDEVVNLGVCNKEPLTDRFFYDAFWGCNRLSKFTFKSGKIARWKQELLDFSPAGWGSSCKSFLEDNSKQVTDDVTYQLYKDDKDWWTSMIPYSRYNHDSAVETINSLPDTSEYLTTAGGINTIKFRGAAGEKTDGGAINTLTDSEIAVATAKGWTVTFV